MVILWTNLDGERVEPSPTRNAVGGSGSKEQRVSVALKPLLPRLFLPLIVIPNAVTADNRSSISSAARSTTIESPSSLISNSTTPTGSSADVSPLPYDNPQLVVVQSLHLDNKVQVARLKSIQKPTAPAVTTRLPLASKEQNKLPIYFGN